MRDWNPRVECGKCAVKRRAGVPLHDDQGGAFGRQHRLERGEDPGARLGKGLSRAHAIEIVIR
jgi:hypothetical protein